MATLANQGVATQASFGQLGAGHNLVTSANVFPQGITIYGRWTAVTATADTTGGVICYLGPAK